MSSDIIIQPGNWFFFCLPIKRKQISVFNRNILILLQEKHENLYLESLHCGRWEDYKERGNDCWHYNCGHLVGLSYMNVSTYDLHLLHLKWIGNSHYHRNTNVGSLLIKYFPVELMFTGLVEKITLSCHSQRLLKILGKRDSSQP